MAGRSTAPFPLFASLLVASWLAAPPGLRGSVEGEAAAATSAPASEGAPADTLRGKVVLVTGSTGGLGREVARRLGRRGARVLVHGRNEERGLALVREIEEETPGSAHFYQADLASFTEVRELAAAVRRDHDRLDVLVNNAGIWLGGPRRESEDGHELHFQVNYLSGFFLTRLLRSLLETTAEASRDPVRIVNVASVAQRPIDFDDVMLESGYDDGRAYAQSKLAQVIFTFDLADELQGRRILVNALHPATLMDTDMVLERGIRPRSSVEEGAEAVLRLITDPEVGSGGYFDGLERADAHPQAYDAAARARLEALSERLTGVGGG